MLVTRHWMTRVAAAFQKEKRPQKRPCSLEDERNLLDAFFHLLQRLDLDLADALGRDLELGGEVVQRELVLLAQPARLDDAAAAGVEGLERPLQAARASLLGLLGLELRERFGVA